MIEQKALITGMACATSLGLRKGDLIRGIEENRCAIKPEYGEIQGIPIKNVGIIDRSHPALKKYDPVESNFLSRLLTYVTEEALLDAKISLPFPAENDLEMIWGSCYGVNPKHVVDLLQFQGNPEKYQDSPGIQELFQLNFREDSITWPMQDYFGCGISKIRVGMECCSSILAISMAASSIRKGKRHIALAGGFDLFDPLIYFVAHNNGLIDPELTNPFGQSHKGFNLADACGVLVLESEEHARERKLDNCYGEIKGWSLACYPSEGSPSIRGICRTIEESLENASMSIENIDFISPHACGVPELDRAESISLRKVFGALMDKIPITTYTMHMGYSFAASAFVDLAIALDSMRHQRILPSCGPKVCDPASDFRFVKDFPWYGPLNTLLKLKLALSGSVGSLVISRFSL